MITGGRVSFTRTVRPADFESKSATVELTFDDQATLDVAAFLAQAKALEMVGLKKPAAEVATSTETFLSEADKAKAAFAAAANAGANTTAGTGSADKAASAADKAGGSKGGRKSLPKSSVPEVNGAAKASAQADPAAIEDDITVTNTPAATTTHDPAAIDDDELFSSAPEDITDEKLLAEIVAHNGKVKNPIKIRELIGVYVKAPGKATEIAKDKRAAFIAELQKIKPLV